MGERSYHHGDLPRALVETGSALLRADGPTAISAREAARELGVSVTALYRHFDSVEQWRADVAVSAREALARAMLDAVAAVPSAGDPAQTARLRFRATGRGYIQFAIDEPNLFAGAFMPCTAAPSRVDDPSAWTVLEAALDELVATGAIDLELRPDAPVIAWTAVHGLAALIVQGAIPVRGDGDREVDAVLDGVARALGVSPAE